MAAVLRSAAALLFVSAALLCAPAARAGSYSSLSSASGRVLLMNRDSKNKATDGSTIDAVTYQGYNDSVNRSAAYARRAVFWVHEGVVNSTYPQYLAGTHHTFYTQNYGKKLWELAHCRAGSACYSPAGNANNWRQRNYLPYSSTATAVGMTAAQKNSLVEDKGGQVIMQDTKNSAVISGVLDEGIGCVYFDAINTYRTMPAGLSFGRIGISVATETLDGREFSEENLLSIDVGTNECNSAQDFIDETNRFNAAVTDVSPGFIRQVSWMEDGTEHTGLYYVISNFYGNVRWQKVPFDVLMVDTVQGRVSELEKGVNEFELNLNTGSCTNFYRVRCDVYNALSKHRGPICLKIQRTGVSTGTDEDGADPDLYVLAIDNILVSYPRMGSMLIAPGERVADRAGSEVIGWENAFDAPFLHAGAEGVKPRLTFATVTNSAVATTPADFDISNVQCHWRWNYLDQTNTQWQTIAMERGEGTNIVSSGGALDLSYGPGDIEYYFTGEQDAPHYEPVDYAFNIGSELGFGEGWTEGESELSCRFGAPVTETGGTNFFCRVREEQSPYEAVRLVAETTWTTNEVTSCVTEVYPMELVATNTWRCYFHAPEERIGGTTRFHFVGINPQTTADEREFSTNEWFLAADKAAISKLPDSGYAVASGEWGSFSLDGSSTHVFFELHDDTGKYQVARASHQNFNSWTDASTGYRGSFFDKDGRSNTGVADNKIEYYTNFYGIAATKGDKNGRWNEPFHLATADSNYQYDKLYKDHITPKNWMAEQSMFVSQTGTNKFGTDGMALKLSGGVGSVEMNHDENSLPDGIDEVSFDARLGQTLGFDDFAYSLNHMSESNYAVSAECTFSALYNATDMSPAAPTMSAAIFYRPGGVGCYEFRVRVLKKNANGTCNLELSLLKWFRSGRGMTNVLMQTPKYVNDVTFANAPYASQSGTTAGNQNTRFTDWESIYISACATNGGTKVEGGIRVTKNAYNIRYNYPNIPTSAKITVTDTIAAPIGAVPPHTRGTFGFACNDCLGYFGYINRHGLTASGVIAHAQDIDGIAFGTTTGGAVDRYTSTATYRELSGGSPEACDWMFPLGRMTLMRDSDRIPGYPSSSPTQKWKFGVRADVATNVLEVYAKPVGKEWSKIGEAKVSSFQTNRVVVAAHTSDKASVKIATAETSGDVVVDNIEVTQWKAEDSASFAEDYCGMDYWVYTQGWMVPAPTASGIGCRLQPRRGVVTKPMGLRSPLIDEGLSYLSFGYTNANKNARILVQVATNGINALSMETYTLSLEDRHWTTIQTNTFENVASNSMGTCSCYFSYRAPLMGAVRLIVDPQVVADSVSNSLDYGAITITEVKCYNEPALDARSWWGWNVWMNGWNPDGTPGARAFLNDASSGLSCSLNWSASEDENKGVYSVTTNACDLVDDPTQWGESDGYAANDPFVQGPELSCGVGQVSFRARIFAPDQNKAAWGGALTSVVSIWGSNTPEASFSWRHLGDVVVDSTTYRTYSWKTLDANSCYSSIRLVVSGAKDGRNGAGAVQSPIQRVMVDDVMIAESIIPHFSFEYAIPFRSGLGEEGAVPDEGTAVGGIPDIRSEDQQPLVGESWGVQAKLKAEQLDDDLDMDNVTVKLAYYPNYDEWGYENWSNSATVAALERIGDSLVFRSTYTKGVVMPINKAPTVVQYHLWVEYFTRGQDPATDAPLKASLAQGEWENPWWYGALDLNAKYGDPIGAFSAYTILDTISPHRAWINCVNYYDAYVNYQYTAATNQFVEVAVPAGADVTGWMLRLTSSTLTNGTLATYGYGDAAGATRKTAGVTNRYAFITLRSPATADAGGVPEAEGKWTSSLPSTLKANGGTLGGTECYGLELVRASGVVEHQIVVQGTNVYARYPDYAYMGSGTNLVADIKAKMYAGVTNTWFFAGEDRDEGTVGVWRSHGEDETCWTNSMMRTPGAFNRMADGTPQDIDPDWYLLPNGTNVYIYATVFGAHMRQVIAGDTNTSAMLVMPVGTSTNILYVIDPWYQIDSVTTNGVPAPDAACAEGTWVLNLNEVDVPGEVKVLNIDANDGPAQRIVDAGLSKDDPYYDAVMHWLSTCYPAGGDLKLAQYVGLRGEMKAQLDIKDMYWLDIDPTQGDWYLRGGITDITAPVFHTNWVDGIVGGTVDSLVTNVRLEVSLVISNGAGKVNADNSKSVYSPYRLRGLEPGSTSDGYTGAVGTPNWTSATFRVRGALSTLPAAYTNKYQTMRWFVFGPNSFDADGKAKIDVIDPFSKASPVYSRGWYDFRDISTIQDIFWQWTIGDEGSYNAVEMLKADSTY